MGYRYGARVKRERKSIKKYLTGAVVSVVAAAGMAIPAMAASNDYCGSSANGCAAASAAGAQCDSGAGSGAFGAFGKDNNWAGGANGQNTGLANSSLCGNRQGNL